MSASVMPREKRRVLVIEDEADLRRLLCYSLENAGYEVRGADSGEEGLRIYEELGPEAVLLDLMLPDVSGTEVCRRIRAQAGKSQPVILMVTAKGDEIDRVVGFEVGADDYVVKPFSVRELMLRLDNRLRAHSTGEATAASAMTISDQGLPRRLSMGPLEVDTAGHHVYVGGDEVHVSALEMRLLLYLLQPAGHVRSRRDLLTHVWGYQPDVTSRTVDTHVKRLRDKLGPAGALIQTVRGLGYRLADLGTGVAEKKKTTSAPRG
jgi:two-component system phosphate regulon response regulator PhoB